MSTTPPDIHTLARQLLASKPVSVGASNDDATPIVPACEKLRGPLTKLAGAGGFSSLLSRSLVLAKRQAPSLEGARVEADGSLAGFEEMQRHVNGIEAAQEGDLILLTELLKLLMTLIGERLTMRLVHEAWPEASIGTAILKTKDKP